MKQFRIGAREIVFLFIGAFTLGALIVAVIGSGDSNPLSLFLSPGGASPDAGPVASAILPPGMQDHHWRMPAFGPMLPDKMTGCWDGTLAGENLQLCLNSQKIEFAPPCLQQFQMTPGYHQKDTLIWSNDDDQVRIKEQGGWNQPAIFGFGGSQQMSFQGEIDCSLQGKDQMLCHEWHHHLMNGQPSPFMPDEDLSFVLTRASEGQ
jgi:hypothetical protein